MDNVEEKNATNIVEKKEKSTQLTNRKYHLVDMV